MGLGDRYVPISPGREIFVNTLPTTVQPSSRISGNGSPEGVVPSVPGTPYVDLASADANGVCDLYLKIAGPQATGWQKIGKWNQSSGGGSSSGTGSVFSGVGDPNGVITPTTSAAIYYDLAGGPSWNWNGTKWI